MGGAVHYNVLAYSSYYRLPPAQIDGAPESYTEAVQLRAQFHVSPYLSTPMGRAPFQPRQHSSHANERIIVTNSRSNGKPITLVEFRKIQSRDPERSIDAQSYSGQLLSARLHSASRPPGVPTNPKKLEIRVHSMTHSHTDTMESTRITDTSSDLESKVISESQHTATVQQDPKKLLVTKITESHTPLECKKQPSSHHGQLSHSSWTRSSSDPASVEVVGKSHPGFSRKPPLSAPLLRKLNPLLKRSNTEHFQSTIQVSEGQSTRQECLGDPDFEDTREPNDTIGKEKDQRKVRFLDQPDICLPEETNTTSMMMMPKNIRCYLRSRDRRQRCQNRSQTTGRAPRHPIATTNPPLYYKRKLLPIHDNFHSQDEEHITAE